MIQSNIFNTILVKIRVLFKRKRQPWSGYYYFALTGKSLEEYLQQKNKRGRPKKKFKFSCIRLYENYDECQLANWGDTIIFKIPFKVYQGNTFYLDVLTTDKAKAIQERKALTFKDILTYENEYDTL